MSFVWNVRVFIGECVYIYVCMYVSEVVIDYELGSICIVLSGTTVLDSIRKRNTAAPHQC